METLAISFIDYGDVRGSFAYCLADSLIKIKDDIPVTHIFRWSSSNIPLNRHNSLKDFIHESDADWLLCIDSDIVFHPDDIKKLWNRKSKEKQVLSGIYFLVKPGAPTDGPILPAIFREAPGGTDGQADHYHPFPQNQIIEIKRAGFGFLLLSRQVVQQVLDSTDIIVFAERYIGDNVVGEDFVFFEHLEKLGIKAYADTNILLGHEKNIIVNANTYGAYWNLIEPSIYGVKDA